MDGERFDAFAKSFFTRRGLVHLSAGGALAGGLSFFRLEAETRAKKKGKNKKKNKKKKKTDECGNNCAFGFFCCPGGAQCCPLIGLPICCPWGCCPADPTIFCGPDPFHPCIRSEPV